MARRSFFMHDALFCKNTLICSMCCKVLAVHSIKLHHPIWMQITQSIKRSHTPNNITPPVAYKLVAAHRRAWQAALAMPFSTTQELGGRRIWCQRWSHVIWVDLFHNCSHLQCMRVLLRGLWITLQLAQAPVVGYGVSYSNEQEKRRLATAENTIDGNRPLTVYCRPVVRKKALHRSMDSIIILWPRQVFMGLRRGRPGTSAGRLMVQIVTRSSRRTTTKHVPS